MKKILNKIILLCLVLTGGTASAQWYITGLGNIFDEYDRRYPMEAEGSSFSITIPVLSSTERFKIVSEKGYSDSYGSQNSGDEFDFEKDWVLTKGSGSKSISVPFTIYNAKIYFHPTRSKPDIYVTGDPETIYMIGNWGQGGTTWNLSSAAELKYCPDEPGTWYGAVKMNQSGSSLNYWRFQRVNDELGPEDKSNHESVIPDTPWTTKFRSVTKSDRSFVYGNAGEFYVTFRKTEDSNTFSFVVSAKPTVVYATTDSEEAWSKDGVTFPATVILDSRGVTIDEKKINVTFAPATSEEGEWISASGRPEGLYDTEWAEWEAIEKSGQYVDGYWDPEKVVCSLKENKELENAYDVYSLLPCSGKYKVTLNSEDYNLLPLGSSETNFTAYPSIMNIWTTEEMKTEEGEYIPLCVNIDGIVMKTNETFDDFNGWYMEYPFITQGEGDETTKTIFNYGNLDSATLYVPGVYMAKIWTKATPTSAEPTRVISKRGQNEKEPSLEDYTPGRKLDLSLMSADGTTIGSNYEISVILSKNGAVTPQTSNRESEEAFIVSPNINAPLPTGIESTLQSEFQPIYFNLQGNRVTKPQNGIFIKVEGTKSTKVMIK